jgi:hypothetical protein
MMGMITNNEKDKLSKGLESDEDYDNEEAKDEVNGFEMMMMDRMKGGPN